MYFLLLKELFKIYFPFSMLLVQFQLPHDVDQLLCVYCIVAIQSNFDGSKTFGTMKICSRQGEFELMSVNHSARPGGILGIFFLIFFRMMVCCVCSLESHRYVRCVFLLESPHYQSNYKIALTIPNMHFSRDSRTSLKQPW